MHADRIRELLHAVPFQPFFIELTSGLRVDIDDPTYIALARSGRRVVVQNSEEWMHMIDATEIVCVAESSQQPT